MAAVTAFAIRDRLAPAARDGADTEPGRVPSPIVRRAVAAV